MKKLLSLLFCCITLSAFAQFPGEDVSIFIGASVRAKEVSAGMQKYYYKNFYTQMNEDSQRVVSKKPFKGTGKNSYADLVGKEFKVVKIYKNLGVVSKNYTLELQNDTLGTLYYDYQPTSEYSYELEFTVAPTLPADFYCKYIEKDTELSENVWYHAAMKEGIQFHKIYKEDEAFYLLFMRFAEDTSALGKTGFSLTLADGSVIERPNEKIKVDVNDYGSFLHSITAGLTEDEIIQISEHPIVKNSMATFTDDVTDGKTISEILKCLLTK